MRYQRFAIPDMGIPSAEQLRQILHAIDHDRGTGRGRVVFAPAPILLGRLWDGRRARCGPWSDPEGWRTLGHEWAHYALGLFDEYFSLDGNQPHYCQSNGFATLLPLQRAPAWVGNGISSLMAYHYTTDLLSDHGSSPEQHCINTPQWVVHGQSSWKTVETRFGWTKQLGPLLDPPVPEVDVLKSTGSSDNVSVFFNNPLLQDTVFGPAYVIQNDPSGADGPLRIIGQGTIWPSSLGPPMRFWGVRPGAGDRAVLMLEQTGSADRFSQLPGQTLELSTNNIAIEQNPWVPVVGITPQFGADLVSGIKHINGLRVDLYNAESAPLQITYCPAGSLCLPLKFMNKVTFEDWTYTFGPSDFAPLDGPAPYGYFYVRQNGGFGREIVFWYQLAGGVGPAHSDGLAPVAEGLLNVELLQNSPLAKQSGLRVIYNPALAHNSNIVSDNPFELPRVVKQIVATPLSVRVFPISLSADLPGKDSGMRVRLNYDQDIFDRLGINEMDENQLVVLERVNNGEWFVADEALQQRDPHLNWISAPLTLGRDGSAVVALGVLRRYLFPKGPVYLPVVVRK